DPVPCARIMASCPPASATFFDLDREPRPVLLLSHCVLRLRHKAGGSDRAIRSAYATRSRCRRKPNSKQLFRSWAVLVVRNFFIMLERCVSTVFSLIRNSFPISRFLSPSQMCLSTCCSRSVNKTTPLDLVFVNISCLLTLNPD